MTVKRPMLWLSVSVVAGMYLLAILGPDVSFAVVFCAVLTALVLFFKTRKLFPNLILAASLVLFCTGAILYGIADDISTRPLHTYCGEPVSLTGEIVEEPEISDRYVRFLLQATSVSTGRDESEAIVEKISVICFFNDGRRNFPVPNRGDILMAECEVAVPDGAMNTGGFDYARYLKSKGVYFQAVANSENLHITGYNTHPVSDAVYQFRNKCASLFDTAFPGKEGGVLKAYVMGDKTSISPEVSDIFSASGLSHVLAVSGMHVAVFLACILALLKFLKISKRKQLVISAGAVILFVVFTGASIATVRAGFVSIFAILAKLVFKRSDSKTALAEAAAILCVFNPLVVFDASFMLSFAAALGILLFADGMSETFSCVYARLKTASKIRAIVKAVCDLTAVGLSANIFIIPILIHLFREFSVMSVIATVVINPVLAPMLVGGLLFVAVGLVSQTIAFPIAGFLYLCAKYMIQTAQIFAGAPFAKLVFGDITPFFLIIYAFAMLVVYFTLVKRNKTGYFISLYSVAALSLTLLCYNISVYHVAEVSFINVGQGDCALIKAPGNCDILIDAGGKKNNNSIGENVVKPYLVQNGVYDIEYAVASHGHEDHVNGITGLLDIMIMKNLIVPEGFGTTTEGAALLEKAKEKDVPVTFFKHGDVLKINDEMKLTAIMPDEKFLSFTKEDNENDRSLLLKLEYGDISFLYTGDLSQEGENYAAALYPELVPANVLKVAHHGSDASNSEKFLDAVGPEFAFIPVGKNSYGHPKQEVLQRLTSRNIEFYRADKNKDVTFYFDNKEIKGIQFDENSAAGGLYELR